MGFCMNFHCIVYDILGFGMKMIVHNGGEDGNKNL